MNSSAKSLVVSFSNIVLVSREKRKWRKSLPFDVDASKNSVLHQNKRSKYWHESRHCRVTPCSNGMISSRPRRSPNALLGSCNQRNRKISIRMRLFLECHWTTHLPRFLSFFRLEEQSRNNEQKWSGLLELFLRDQRCLGVSLFRNRWIYFSKKERKKERGNETRVWHRAARKQKPGTRTNC